MIVASLLLIAAATAMLGLGLWQSASGLLTSSIGASLLAAILLVVAARRAAAARTSPGGFAEPATEPSSGAPTVTIPTQGTPLETPPPPMDEDADPPDEPAPQQVSAADAAKVGRMMTEVLVVDGRPRYHLPGCVHLLGRESEPLPVSEAIELGFTPCSLCEPDSALLADARRV